MPQNAKRSLAFLVTSLIGLALVPMPATANPAPLLSAVLDGSPIALKNVSKYHCDDVDYPLITCFDTAAERDDHVQTQEGAARASGAPVPGVAYVIWYAAANYLGASFTASASYSDLATITWNDSISSFKSLNNGRPKWWDGTNFTGTAWHWLAGAQVSYVGDGANDKFSSVENVP